jgi:hypothetical protein
MAPERDDNRVQLPTLHRVHKGDVVQKSAARALPRTRSGQSAAARQAAWLPTIVGPYTVISRVERLAMASAASPSARNEILSVLLGSTIPIATCGGSEDRILWVNEAMQRAYATISLIGALDATVPLQRCDTTQISAELNLAKDLASIFKEASIPNTEEAVACSRLLRRMAHNVVEMFGLAVGNVKITTSIEPTTLPAIKRRALIFLVNELITNAIRHGLLGRTSGNIVVAVTSSSKYEGHLRVEDDGCGYVECLNRERSVADDLAALLGSGLSYTSRRHCFTRAELSFAIGR